MREMVGEEETWVSDVSGFVMAKNLASLTP